MELIQHSINWCKGEIFEGKVSLIFGVLIFLIAIGLWKFGTTPYAKALVIPTAIMALLVLGIGYYLISANHKRIDEFQELYLKNRNEFIQKEKQRTDEFIAWYPKTRIIMMGVMVIGMVLRRACIKISKGDQFCGWNPLIANTYLFLLDTKNKLCISNEISL